MKRKISTTLAVTLIASQVQGTALAETMTNIQEVDAINGNLPKVTESTDKETKTDQSINNELQEEAAEEEKTEEVKEEKTEEVKDEKTEEVKEEKTEEVKEEKTEEVKEEKTEEVKEEIEEVKEEIEEVKEEEIEDVANSTEYEITGKLELDMNFSMPIKYKIADETNISVNLKKDGQVIGTVKLGSDITAGTIEGTNIRYNLEALNSKRTALESDATELEFYHLTFENVGLGTYSLEISGAGYETAVIDNIDIQDTSKRVLVGTSDKTIVLNDKEEIYPGVFLAGDVNDKESVTKDDYDEVKSKIKSNDKKYDLNRDGKVDITDLTYVHQNMGKDKKEAIIVDTDIIVNPERAEIPVNDEKVEVTGDIKDILKDNGSSVKLKPKEGEVISPENPISIPINLAGITRSGSSVEKVAIEAPAETAPGTGSVVIPNGNGQGKDLVVEFNETNSKRIAKTTRDGKEMDVIEIDLGKQVAVSQITINVTGGRGNQNLTEIAKVDFLNNVYKELPKPDMNIPVINNFTSSTAVGNEAMTIGWRHEQNVTGYEIKVEELNEKGDKVVATSTYKTSENTLKIEKVKGYTIYRVSIQSLNGDDWKSGYKDEQDDYVRTAVGDTNLTTNINDKDGIADNVDSNFIPHAWDSSSGELTDKATDGVENPNYYGKDSIVEFKVIPETAPEGPEGIVVEGMYKALNVKWKAHKKAKDYDLYYREIGTGEWIKANDPDKSYKDSNPNNDIPDGVADLSPEEKTDQNELIRGENYTITDLKDNTTYEIKMTGTNHHGTGGLSQTYIGSTSGIKPPKITNYKLINKPVEGEISTSSIIDVEYGNWDKESHPNGMEDNKFAIVDNDYTTYWTSFTWNSSHGSGPLVTFDKEYTMDTIRIATRLDGRYAAGTVYDYVPVRYYDSNKGEFVEVNAKYTTLQNNGTLYYEVKLPEPITTNKIQTALRINPSYGNAQKSSISEIKFYEYDSLERDVENLFKDDLMIELREGVTQTEIDDLTKRAKTIDADSMEYHPKQDELLEDLTRAQQLYDDVNISAKIINFDSQIRNNASKNSIGQSNDWQALGVAVKPGDKVNIYIGSPRKDTKFNLAITQHYAESGTAYQVYTDKLSVGKNEITIPESKFNMDYEKGGMLYLNLASGYADNQNIQVRVSGGTEVPHLNLNNMMDDKANEAAVKDKIRTYIRELKSYVSTVKNKYPETVTPQDRANNIYTYDAETSILNSTEIESDRVTLSLPANQVLSGIQSGLGGDENAEVERVYDTLLAWEQLMKVSYAQQGLLEEAVDFDEDGKISDIKLEELGGISEKEYFDKHRAPKNRINIKYQRMFTGAFMYASGHHVGIGYGSAPDMMQGVPFEYDANGNLVNKDGQLFGWGINHEIGHVHDRPGLTYAETTNNILSLITQTFDDEDLSRIESSDAYKTVYDKVTSGSIGLSSSGLARLAMFWQLHLAYDDSYTYEMLDINTDSDLSNDTIYAKLYREARIRGIAPAEQGHDAVAQTFIMRASDAAKKDLRPFFAKWGLIASPNTNAYLNKAGYEQEDKAIYYLNDEARRRKLDAGNDISKITKADDTVVNATFGTDKNGNQITERNYLDQKEVPLKLSVNKDADKILGYEIIRSESKFVNNRIVTEDVVVGFVEADRESENGVTEYVDVIDSVNNRSFTYKVKAYDYALNATEATRVGNIKVNHEGSIAKSDWTFETNTRSADDVADENTGHGQAEGGAINNIKDNDLSTVYNASKVIGQNNQEVSGDPYVTVDMGDTKSVVGLKYTPGNNETKKFSLRNIFRWKKETTYEPISEYEVYVSNDGSNWTRAHKGKFDTTKENTIYFNENGTSDNTQLWAYDAKYVKLVAKNAKTISIAELDILGPTGDNIEIGVDNGDKVYKNGIGRLASDYKYGNEDGQVIPKGSIVITGEYKGDPAYNLPLVLNENDENYAIKAQAILLANLPEDAELGQVAEGNWIYWITPDQEKEEINGANNIEGKSIKALLYRYNKLNESGNPVGQRLVSDTFLVDVPELDSLPSIDFNGGTGRSVGASYDKVVEISNEMMQKAYENR